MTDISVIVPIYKVEQFVARCVTSIARQQGVSTEIILVDDCGGDRSIAVAEETLAALGYASYRVLRHEHNRGLSAARNTGTAKATGRYVYYIDSDDWLAREDALKTMFEAAEKADACCVVGLYADCEADSGKLLNVPYNYGTDQIVRGEESVRSVYSSKCIPVTAWNKLIRRDFLQANDLTFREGILHEDTLWTFQLMALLPSLMMLNKVTYHYAINPESIMNKMSEEKYRRRKDSCEVVLSEMYAFMGKHSICSQELRNYIEETRNYMYLKLIVDGLGWRDMKAFFRKTFRRLSFSQWRAMPTKLKVLHAYQLMPYPMSFWAYKTMASIQQRR